jgi:hypothetical protein
LIAKGISPTVSSAPTDLSPPEVADLARKFAVQISCQGISKEKEARVANAINQSYVKLGEVKAPLTRIDKQRLRLVNGIGPAGGAALGLFGGLIAGAIANQNAAAQAAAQQQQQQYVIQQQQLELQRQQQQLELQRQQQQYEIQRQQAAYEQRQQAAAARAAAARAAATKAVEAPRDIAR